jgi:hypothetical protein
VGGILPGFGRQVRQPKNRLEKNPPGLWFFMAWHLHPTPPVSPTDGMNPTSLAAPAANQANLLI